LLLFVEESSQVEGEVVEAVHVKLAEADDTTGSAAIAVAYLERAVADPGSNITGPGCPIGRLGIDGPVTIVLGTAAEDGRTATRRYIPPALHAKAVTEWTAVWVVPHDGYRHPACIAVTNDQ